MNISVKSSALSLKILLVDDHVMITDFYKMALAKLKNCEEITSTNSLKKAYEFIFNKNRDEIIDLVILDLSMPEYPEKSLNNGEDLAKLIRVKNPETKIIFITGYCNLIRLNSVLHNINPEGIIEKSDVDYNSFIIAFNKIIDGELYKSETIRKTLNNGKLNNVFFDSLNRQIIVLISQGITTKNIPHYLPLTLSAVHKRKSKIKELLQIEHGNDEDIIRESQKKGII
jgi:DNA-binding NarL/FixJ family response regulator